MVLRPLLNAHRIGNSMRLIVIRWSRVDFRFEIAMMGVLFTNAIPARFYLHAVGDIAVLDPEQAVQREFRHQSVSRPMDFFPAIDRAGRYRHIDRNLRRRSEEHTSELQSHSDLVCRLLLEK